MLESDYFLVLVATSVLFGLGLAASVFSFRAVGRKPLKATAEGEHTNVKAVYDCDPEKERMETERERQQVCDEFLASEERYLNRLLLTQNKFLVPLTLMKKKILSNQDMSSQFFRWEELIKTHMAFQKSLSLVSKGGQGRSICSSSFGANANANGEIDGEDKQEEDYSGSSSISHRERGYSCPHTCLAEVVTEFAPSFRIYGEYLANFETAQQRRAELMTTNKRFAAFLAEAEGIYQDKDIEPSPAGSPVNKRSCEDKDHDKSINNNSSNSSEDKDKNSRSRSRDSQYTSVESLLVEPVQRLPQYRLLLAQLDKLTPTDHPEKAAITLAVSEIGKVARANNDAILDIEDREKVLGVMGSLTITTRVNLLSSSSRRLVREGTLLKQCRKADKPFHFWLFSDMLMYGEASSGLLRRTFALHRQIPLEQARFTGLPSKPDGDCREEKGVLVECPEKSFVVWHDSQVDRDNWLADLDKCVSVLRERSAVEMGTVAPLWAPDGEHLDCMLCFEPFSLVFRRHHCRRCGRVVCDSCSKHRAFLSNIDASKAVRICSECNGVLHKKRKSLTL